MTRRLHIDRRRGDRAGRAPRRRRGRRAGLRRGPSAQAPPPHHRAAYRRRTNSSSGDVGARLDERAQPFPLQRDPGDVRDRQRDTRRVARRVASRRSPGRPGARPSAVEAGRALELLATVVGMRQQPGRKPHAAAREETPDASLLEAVADLRHRGGVEPADDQDRPTAEHAREEERATSACQDANQTTRTSARRTSRTISTGRGRARGCRVLGQLVRGGQDVPRSMRTKRAKLL